MRRIAWLLQVNAWGGLSERALRRVEELAHDADVRTISNDPAVVAATIIDGLNARDRSKS